MKIQVPVEGCLIIDREYPKALAALQADARRGVWLPGNAVTLECWNGRMKFIAALSGGPYGRAWWSFVMGNN